MKSIKELVKTSQSVSALYSDSSPKRYTDSLVPDCSISSALAKEILQSCAKPWIWYQCICGVVCPLFFRNIFCKTWIIHWSPNGPSMVGPSVIRWIHGSHLATVFQQHCCGRRRRCEWRRRTNQYKNIKSPPVYQGDLINYKCFDFGEFIGPSGKILPFKVPLDFHRPGPMVLEGPHGPGGRAKMLLAPLW